jgi:hypothetical protein
MGCPHYREVAGALILGNQSRRVIAKLDRLSRNLTFLAFDVSRAWSSRRWIIPTANKLTIHILAPVAEHQRQAISEPHQGGSSGRQRTKKAILFAIHTGVVSAHAWTARLRRHSLRLTS